VAALEELLAALRRDGFSDEGAALAATTLTGWASGFGVFEARDRSGVATPPGLPEADARFEYGLAVLLDGIEAAERRRTDEERPKAKRHRKDGDRPRGKHHRRDEERRKGDHRPR
jgi:hypothetical protein